jgi:hypothetical protein
MRVAGKRTELGSLIESPRLSEASQKGKMPIEDQIMWANTGDTLVLRIDEEDQIYSVFTVVRHRQYKYTKKGNVKLRYDSTNADYVHEPQA